jgi:hypothetical protein
VLAGEQPAVNPQAAALKEFGDRVRGYVALHEKIASALPSVDGVPAAEALDQRRDALAAGLRQARRDAHEGDLFTPAVGAQIKAMVRRDLQSRDFRDAIAAVEEVAFRTVWVNMSWPQNAPRPTIPPRLLTNLYPLPQDLEYRFLDRHLVLLDVDAELVVDLVRNVLPSRLRPSGHQ